MSSEPQGAVASDVRPGQQVRVPWAGRIESGYIVSAYDRRVIRYLSRVRRGGRTDPREVWVAIAWQEAAMPEESVYPFWCWEVEAIPTEAEGGAA